MSEQPQRRVESKGSADPNSPRKNQVLVREIRPAGAAWSPGAQPAQGDPANRVLVVLPVVVSELLLQRFANKRFTWLHLWGDLRALTNRVIADEFKVVVHQPATDREPPKLFLCALTGGLDQDDAYLKGIERLMRLVSALTRRVGYGFNALLHEAITFPLMAWAPPEGMEGAVSIRNIDLVICEGRISAILTPVGYTLERAPFRMQIGPKDGIITTFVEIPKYEADLGGSIPVQDDTAIRDFEQEIASALIDHAPEIALDHLHALTLLYNAALTTDSMSIGFLLLWQVLESAADIRDSGKPLVTDEVWGKMQPALADAGLDAQAQQRIRGALAQLKTKGQNSVIAEMLKEYVEPEQELELLLKNVKGYRNARGSISHPKTAGYEQFPQLMKQYSEIRRYVSALLRKLSGAKAR